MRLLPTPREDGECSDLYLRHINQYLDFCESLIEKRGAEMVKILASKMGY